jgi:pimeloyl-ACP methyl ester carboxylesterase
MQSGFLSFKGSTIHYVRAGIGNRVVVCFHGYGESSANFNFLSQAIGTEFSLVAFDLPFHGETEWNNGNLYPDEVGQMLIEILQQEKLPVIDITLIGFSLGGRIALSAYTQIANSVSRLVLLAPDGLKLNFWYWLATQTSLGKLTFKQTMKKPGWFLSMLRLGNRIKLINRSIYKFVDYYIHDERVRQELYDRWMSMRYCKPDLDLVRKEVQANRIPVRLLYGKHDRIILPSPGLRFINHLPNAQIEMLDCGHQVLHPKNATQIASALIN